MTTPHDQAWAAKKLSAKVAAHHIQRTSIEEAEQIRDEARAIREEASAGYGMGLVITIADACERWADACILWNKYRRN